MGEKAVSYQERRSLLTGYTGDTAGMNWLITTPETRSVGDHDKPPFRSTNRIVTRKLQYSNLVYGSVRLQNLTLYVGDSVSSCHPPEPSASLLSCHGLRGLRHATARCRLPVGMPATHTVPFQTECVSADHDEAHLQSSRSASAEVVVTSVSEGLLTRSLSAPLAQ